MDVSVSTFESEACLYLTMESLECFEYEIPMYQSFKF